MHGIHHKERWQLDGCLLYFRGGHHRNRCQAGLHPSIWCPLLLSCRICSPFSYHERYKNASHDITGETELQDEAITVKAMAPTEAHMSTYTMVWHAKPSKGGGRPHTSPQQTPTGGETPHHLHVELGDLNNHELHQLVADLNQELAQCELIVPPSDPPPNEWSCPSGSQEPEEDDQEVTFPGGGRWGLLRQPTPEQPAEGGAPSGPPQRPPCPAPAGPDIRQLITTLTLGLHIGTPKISTFSGDVAPGKTEVSYEQWSHEVQCIKTITQSWW